MHSVTGRAEEGGVHDTSLEGGQAPGDRLDALKRDCRQNRAHRAFPVTRKPGAASDHLGENEQEAEREDRVDLRDCERFPGRFDPAHRLSAQLRRPRDSD